MKLKTSILQEQIRLLLESGDLDTARRIEAKAHANGDLTTSLMVEFELAKFITCNPTMLALKDKVRALFYVQDPVLILGETGTGKELVARALHGSRTYIDKESKEQLGRFVEINCAAIPAELLESELFGYEAGAFTGASKEGKKGLMQAAFKGTLFLDEISEMPLTMQAKLLRVLQGDENKKMWIRKVGGTSDIEVNFRLVCATNRNIQDHIKDGKFRQDLYYRISTIELFTLPLRERKEDIAFLSKTWDKTGQFSSFLLRTILADNAALNGNVRELQRIHRRWELFGEE